MNKIIILSYDNPKTGIPVEFVIK